MFFSNETKKYLKKMLVLAIPIIFTEMLTSSVNLIDTVMIGSLGINEITAVGLANQIFFVYIIMMFGVSSGGAIFMGQFWGKGDTFSIHKSMGIVFVSGLIVSSVFAGTAILIPEKLMSIYSNDPVVIELASKYLRTVCISYFFTAFALTVNQSLRCIGKTKYPLISTFSAILVNVIFNYYFIYILKMGVTGAALATVISRFVEIIVQIIMVKKLRLPIVGKLSNYFSANLNFVKEFYKVTIFVLINEVFWVIGTTLYVSFYKYTGTSGQGAYQIASTAQQIFFTVCIGTGSSAGIMIANALGAGERDLAIRYSRKCIKTAIVAGILMGILFAASAPIILSFFNITDEVRHLAQNCIYVMAAGMFIRMTNYATIVGILRSGGDTKFCLVVDGLAIWIIGVPLAYLGAAVLGLPVYFVLLLTLTEELIKIVVSVWRVLGNKWANSVVENL